MQEYIFTCYAYILVNHEAMPLLHLCAHSLHFHARSLYTSVVCPCYSHCTCTTRLAKLSML